MRIMYSVINHYDLAGPRNGITSQLKLYFYSEKMEENEEKTKGQYYD